MRWTRTTRVTWVIAARRQRTGDPLYNWWWSSDDAAMATACDPRRTTSRQHRKQLLLLEGWACPAGVSTTR